MAGKIVILDRHRSEADRLVVMIRRELIRESREAELDLSRVARNRALHARLVDGPAVSLDEVAQRAVFLLDRLTLGEDHSGTELRRLIRRVLQDVVRLAGVGATQPCH